MRRLKRVVYVRAAIRFLRANAVKHHLQTDKSASRGSSVGGNPTALAGTSGAGHGGPAFGNPANTRKILDFLDRHWKSCFRLSPAAA